jgi:hypothetical protein
MVRLSGSRYQIQRKDAKTLERKKANSKPLEPGDPAEKFFLMGFLPCNPIFIRAIRG